MVWGGFPEIFLFFFSLRVLQTRGLCGEACADLGSIGMGRSSAKGLEFVT